MMSKHMKFTWGQMTELAQYLAQLEREGVTYSVSVDLESIAVTLTGGY